MRKLDWLVYTVVLFDEFARGQQIKTVYAAIVCEPDPGFFSLTTKKVTRSNIDFWLVRYLKGPKSCDGLFGRVAKCLYGGHL